MTPTQIPLPYRPAGVMFHHFHGEGNPVGQGSISASDLDQMVMRIGRERILGAQEWQEKALARALRPGDLCLTFDDNLLCQYSVAVPVLRHHKLTAFFFVYTSVNQGALERLEIYRYFRTIRFSRVEDFYECFFDFLRKRPEANEVEVAVDYFNPAIYLPDYVYLSKYDKIFRYVRDHILGRDRYENAMDDMLFEYKFDKDEMRNVLWMNDHHIRELNNEGHIIGLHSHTHPTLMAGLSADDQRKEFIDNLSHLNNVLGGPILSMSHPNNSYSQDTLDILADIGIRIGFRANMTSDSESLLELPRHNHALIHRSIQDSVS
jgi:peptidoglycan/xylan/chitin deacetylase (PgdA/CDA1 family)